MKPKLSGEGRHLNELSTAYLRKARALHVTHYLRSADGTVRPRPFVPVTIAGEELLADAITGSLYRNGQCLTSKQLRIVEAPPEIKPKRRRGCSLAQIASGFANDRLRGMAA